MAGISGKRARIRHTAAAATSSTNNAATLAPGGLVLTIDSTALRRWNRNNSSALQIFDGATNRTTDIAETRWAIGQVVLDQARSTASSWTIDVETYASSFLVNGRDWSVDVETNALDTTTMSTSGTDPSWRSMKAGLNSATVSIGRLFPSSSTQAVFTDRIVLAQDLIVELVADNAGGERYVGYGRVTGDGVTVDLDGLAEESVDIQIDGELFYSTL